MSTGAITAHIDVAQITLYVFWVFFAGLVYYLHRENKREGYPLQSDRSDRAPRVVVQGFPAVPEPKTFRIADGRRIQSPNFRGDARELALRPAAPHPGAAFEPTGDPMRDGVGPASWSERADVFDLTVHGDARIVPLREATDHWVAEEDPNPIGCPVLGADGIEAGVVNDIWVDRSEVVARYFEVTLAGGQRVLLPVNFTKVVSNARRSWVTVRAILASQFAHVPTTRSPDRITLLEEDKICGYYGGGTLYATPSRQEPLL